MKTTSRVRWVLLALAAFASGAAIWQIVTADRIEALDAARLKHASSQWRSAAMADYSMEVAIEGKDVPHGLYAVEVRSGKPISVIRDGIAINGDFDAYTVDGLMGTLERELMLAENPQGALGAPAGYRAYVQATFDPILGVPQRFRRVVGGGSAKWVEWRVTRFEPRTAAAGP